MKTEDLQNEQVQQLQSELAKRAREVEKLLEQNGTLLQQKKELQRTLEGILESRSWKMTERFRRIAYSFRSVWPLIRFRKTSAQVVPGNNIAEREGAFEVTGPSASFVLETTNIPTGWVSVESELQSPKGQLFFLLYYGLAGSFTGDKRFWLSLEDNGKNPPVVFIPHNTEALRLDPFESEGSFSLRSLHFRQLGTLQVWWRVLLRQLRPMTQNPRMVWSKGRQAIALLRHGGFHSLRLKLLSDNSGYDYQDWIRRYDTLSETDRQSIKRGIEQLQSKPVFSVLLPTFNTPREFLLAAVQSVTSQLYPYWELCIADDASTDPETLQTLKQLSTQDKRIKVHFRTENGHISEATNSALDLASGEWVTFLDHDDLLREHALYLFAHEINQNPEVLFLYSDEDKLNSLGTRVNPYFKPGWSPELLLSQNYICHLTAYRTSLVREVGGLRKGVEGAQDWDLALRISEKIPATTIRHVPHILYHWRIVEGSTAQATAFKPYVLEAQRMTVGSHLQRTDRRGEVQILQRIAQLKVVFEVPTPAPLVSLIIPTRDLSSMLERCVKSILEKTTYENFEVIIVDNQSVEEETFQLFESLQADRRIRVIRDDGEFNYSRINNQAVEEAKGAILAFLNNDLEVISPQWLTEMVSYAVQDPIGAVGARLLYPNGLLQHAGVILGIGGVAGHCLKGRRREDPGYFNKAILPQNFSAVTAACMVTRREVFLDTGAFDEGGLSVAFNDIDLCLRIRSKGYRIVCTPYAELFHHESASRGYELTPEKFARFEREIETMKKRWEPTLKNDPYYNPNLTLLSEDFAFAFPPRANRPWKDQ